MQAADFSPSALARGHKYTFDLEVATSAGNIGLPVLLARGSREGKTLVATAGVHGDEYEGVQAILSVYQRLNPEEMTGDFLAVPVANPPAFWHGTRTSPLDGGNLARLFPGRLGAEPTSAIAYHLAHSIISHADFFIDLHSAGVKWLMPTLVGYDRNDPRSAAAAHAFGATILWAHDSISPGRTLSFAASRNIPWLYTEARGAGRIHPADLRCFVDGLWNLMQHLTILPGDPRPVEVELQLAGSGDIDAGLTATQRGFFIPEVGLLESVRAGQGIGRLYDLRGKTQEVFRAPRAGVVALVRQFPVVEPGEPLFLFADKLS